MDIVVQQLQLAQGKKLPIEQDKVVIAGWAMECRINAEDPFNQFFPSTGTIRQHDVPTGPGVRVDTGVFTGAEISPYYDPMIAKLICYGVTRKQAMRRMGRALAEYHILGVTANIPFHQNILQDERFIAGNFDTRFVEERFSMEQRQASSDAQHRGRRDPGDPGQAPAHPALRPDRARLRRSWLGLEALGPLEGARTMKYITTIDQTQFELELLPDGQVAVNGRTVAVDLKEIDGGQSFTLLVDGRSYEGFLLEENGVMQVVIEGVRYSAEVLDEHEMLLREVSASAKGLDERFELTAPMPGLVVKVPVALGDEVKEGDVLVILESMKMQNELKAPQSGRVIEVNVAEGGNVEKRDVMVALGPLEMAEGD